MKNSISKIKKFLADEQGAEAVEWIMVAAVLAAIITAVFWSTLKTAMESGIGEIKIPLKIVRPPERYKYK